MTGIWDTLTPEQTLEALVDRPVVLGPWTDEDERLDEDEAPIAWVQKDEDGRYQWEVAFGHDCEESDQSFGTSAEAKKDCDEWIVDARPQWVIVAPVKTVEKELVAQLEERIAMFALELSRAGNVADAKGAIWCAGIVADCPEESAELAAKWVDRTDKPASLLVSARAVLHAIEQVKALKGPGIAKCK